MSKQSEFWKQIVNEYTEVSKKLRDFGIRISQGNLLNTDEGVEYRKLKETLDRLIWSMGVEFPNLHAHHVMLRGKDVPTLIEYLEDRWDALLADLPKEKPDRSEYGTLESYRDDYALWELRQKHAPKQPK